MSSRIEINLTGVTFTDERHDDVGAAAFKLSDIGTAYPDIIENRGHDFFTQQDLVIRDASGGGGNLLALGAGNDYLLSEEDTSLTTRVTAAVGSTRTVYQKIQIINAAYQAGDLYFSGKYIADSNSAEDYNWNIDRVKTVDDSDYVITNDDNFNEIWVDASSANREVTMPDPTEIKGLRRKIVVRNAGAGTHKITLLPDAAETFNVMSGNNEWTLSSFELIQAGDWCEFISDGTNWIKCNEPYWHKFNNPGTGDKTTQTAGWTANQFTPGGFEVTYSEAPIGAVKVESNILQGGTKGVVYYRKSGDSNISNVPTMETSHRVLDVDTRQTMVGFWLSDDRKIELAVSNVNTDLFMSYPSEYLQ